ncbi:hypothetical protein CCR75_000514 [Bremia lactucae]|uniref:Reverse transcriptase RNase H-like domain-containing protein n=1 Tax=Bremia lactucae TaxID=4779 RepID=A0A976NYP1_BRELC|nr:hypothetical protein CCR75_000514 [Bremia lactucae]
MDAFNFAIGRILYRKEGKTEYPITYFNYKKKPTKSSGTMKQHEENEDPIAYTGRKMKPAELNYPFQGQELFAIMHAFEVWRV